MGVTKTELFSEDQNRIAEVAKILAHPARVAILEHLLSAPSCITGDLVQEVGLAQATVSQHLKELKLTGIIKGTIEGVSVSYCIDLKKWAEIKTILCGLLDRYPSPDDSCC